MAIFTTKIVCLEKLPSKIWTYDIGSEEMSVSDEIDQESTIEFVTLKMIFELVQH
jgi:hypothetical protein